MTDNDVAASASQTPSAISRVAIKPPPFWKGNPSLWFAQIEAQFAISNITTDSTKFFHVVSVVESHILDSVSDIITSPPEDHKYETLKKRLIAVHGKSREACVHELLYGVELGDQRPSQLLSRMRSLASDTFGDELLKSLWLARLPSNAQTVLASSTDDLTKLASVADKIHDLAHPPSINSVVSHSSASTNPFEQRLEDLAKQVNELSTFIRQRGRPDERHSRSPSSNRSPRRQHFYKEPENGWCFYHSNFGSRARKCATPCSFFRKPSKEELN